MSGPVDVLKVLSHHEAALRAKCGTPLNELFEARAAVAELIEAAAELADSQGGPWERGNAYISARGAENMNAAMKKVRAALARVQGAA